ncbi:EAL domain-containing protein [Candidatus Halobeggiatoa sp. HSG11]|nr:EAL domain-containing protein [Candidatus Halobeggiatoa sp. HSG11]
MHILLIEDDAKDYLEIRQLLEQQLSQITIDWAPNYDINSQKIERGNYDMLLIGYRATQKQQQKFLDDLENYITIPTILLTKDHESVDAKFIERYHTHFLRKEQLTWSQLQQTYYHLSHSIKNHDKIKIFQKVFDNAFEFMWLIDAAGILHEVNTAALKLSNSKYLDVITKPIWDATWASQKTKLKLKTVISITANGKFTRHEIEIQKLNGQSMMLAFLFTPLFNEENKLTWILIEGRDLCERNALEQQLDYSNLHDQLTGLPNRHLFLEHLELAISKANDDYLIAILFLDLDRFTLINGSLGHDMGDWLIMEISQRLQDYLSENDILARSSGGKFLILLENMKDLSVANQLAFNINKDILSVPFSLDGYSTVNSASIGIAYYTQQEEAATLLRNADIAMQRAKSKGKACYVVFSSGMYDQTISRLQIETDLHQAIDKKDFILLHQPQFELATGDMVGIEALIHFRHPNNGLISSIDFTPLLEETGLIVPFGEWSLETACYQLRKYINAGLPIGHIAVNLSIHQFCNKQLLQIVTEVIKRAELEPEYLELEFTENLLSDDIRSSVRTLTLFKNMGIRITIDNFGTGHSPLTYLKKFPIDRIKIDKSFVKGINSSPEDTAITVATIEMAHALGLTVVANGVSTEEQRDFLLDQGCDFAQGDLYSPLLEYENMLKWGVDFVK